MPRPTAPRPLLLPGLVLVASLAACGDDAAPPSSPGDATADLDVDAAEDGPTTAEVSIDGSAIDGSADVAADVTHDAEAGRPARRFVVVRIGDGTTALSSAAAPVFLEERTLDPGPLAATMGALVAKSGNPLALPTATAGAQRAITLAGDTPQGFLARSADGAYLALAGYAAPPGTPLFDTTSTSVARVVARVSASGAIDTTTVLGAAFERNSVRAVATIDGSGYWVSGTSTGAPPTGGVHYVAHGATAGTRILDAPNNLRGVGIFGGQLWASSSDSAWPSILEIGAGTPVTAGQKVTRLDDASAAIEPFGFVFLDRRAEIAGLDTLYVANDATSILKLGFDGARWSLVAAWPVPGVIALAAFDEGAAVRIVATTETSVVTLLDDGSTSTVPSTIVEAAPNTKIRGIAEALP